MVGGKSSEGTGLGVVANQAIDDIATPARGNTNIKGPTLPQLTREGWGTQR